MDTVTVNGMVLSSMPIGEYDRRVLLLTAERGRISAFLRGARKAASPLQAASRLFAVGQFTLYMGKDSYTVGQVQIREYFEALALDPVKAAYGCYFLELAGYFAEENVEARDLLNLLYLSLKALQEEKMPASLVRMAYELRCFAIEGEYPQVFSCSRCGKPLTEGQLLLRRGNCLCTDCAKETGERGVALDASAVYTLQFIYTVPLTRLFAFTLTPAVQETLAKLLEGWKGQVLKREFNSWRVLRDMLLGMGT